MQNLPGATLSVIEEMEQQRPHEDLLMLVSEIVTKLHETKQLTPAMNHVGDSKGFVQAIMNEVRRLRSLRVAQ